MKSNPEFISYSHQSIDEDDIAAVCSALRSDYLTTGPLIEKFEQAICNYTGAKYGVAVSSGTAALHCAMNALNIGHGDEIIVPAMTFAATANCVCFMGATPVFVDVESDTLLIDPDKIEDLINSKTKAIIGVDYAGQPCEWDKLRTLADKYDLALVADSCHAIGAEHKGRKVGTLADMTVFSFHPVKHITTGEGGLIVTDNEEYAQRMQRFRNHGMINNYRQRGKTEIYFSEMVDLGYNYRITDIQCALGISQLEKLPKWITRRQKIAKDYDIFFTENKSVNPLKLKHNVSHAYHLYVVRVVDRDKIFITMRDNGIGVNVHYMPVYLHPFYKRKFGYKKGLSPVAEDAYNNIISLPLWPGMKENDILHIKNCLLIANSQ
ncbi:MAG: UDP-4-amino-4,6-dideoxy-N-acetyl-beta-L-altrosamine transaminase [Desulfobacteraceae bacterium]|nr:UDP-4-amino-4,6-dideoxy-N-acetyl-beta-L-altrosamine transaminase [Desulfobacteraceae bacterium]